jgi:hypothetical protein
VLIFTSLLASIRNESRPKHVSLSLPHLVCCRRLVVVPKCSSAYKFIGKSFRTLASFAATSIFLYLPLFFSVTENHWWRISGDPSILDHSDLQREFLGERLVSFVILVEGIEQEGFGIGHSDPFPFTDHCRSL